MIALTGGARIVALATLLAFAAAFGLAVGNVLNEQRATGANAGYPEGWGGGAAIPITRTATAVFSQSALEAVQVARGDTAAASSAAEPTDYFQRHPEVTRSTRIPPNVE